jgi:cation:H+ antiporter
MLPLAIWILIFILSIALLVKGSDWFTDAAEHLSHRLGISPFIIGVTVVSIGTSLPELASSIAAVVMGESSIVTGNVMGSNIANIFLVLGAGAIVAGNLKSKWEMRKVDLPILFAATFLLAMMVIDGSFSFYEGIFLLVGYGVYLHYLHHQHRLEDAKLKKTKGNWLRKVILPLLGGGLLVYFGATYTVQSVIEIASRTAISSGTIAVTAIALGTSLPELMVTVVAVLKKKQEMALGNVLGSNIFNIFGVMGISSLFGTLIVPYELLTFALPMLVVATFMMYFVTAQDKTVTKWEGCLLLLLYAFFVIMLL